MDGDEEILLSYCKRNVREKQCSRDANPPVRKSEAREVRHVRLILTLKYFLQVAKRKKIFVSGFMAYKDLLNFCYSFISADA